MLLNSSDIVFCVGFFESSDAVLAEVEKHPQWLTIGSDELHANLSSFKELGFSDETLREIARSESHHCAYALYPHAFCLAALA